MSSLLYVLICLSLHACNARHLGDNSQGFHISGKDLVQEKEKVLIPSIVSLSFSKGMRTQEKIVGENDETGIHESWGGAKEDMTKEVGLAGNENIALSSQEVLQEATKIEEWKRQARRMLGSTSQNAEETVDHSKEDDTLEDIVVMDYAQPHRKPPIHNREP